MHSIDEILIELVIRHDCVIIPTFGGFITQVHPARLDVKNGIIFPPSKHLLFNKNLFQNDGLLISAFVDFNDTSYEKAQQYILDFVQTIKRELNAGKKVEFEKIGTFHLNNEGTLIFEQNKYFNLLLEAYGLGQVIFVPGNFVEQEPEIEVEKVIEEKRIESNQVEKEKIDEPVSKINEVSETPIIPLQRKRTWVKYAAAACLLPIAFYSFWIPTQTNVLQSGVITLEDFNPFSKVNQPSDKSFGLKNGISTPKLKVPEKKEILPEEPIINNEPEQTSIEEPIQNPTIETSIVSKSEIIIGCFSSNQNAENLVKSLRAKGFDAKIVPGGELIRVSIGGANNTSEENLLIQKAKDQGFESWVLK